MKFNELNLAPQLTMALSELSIEELTEAQQACLPHIINGEDAAVRAKTGSGKTFAFGLALLQGLIGTEKDSHSGLFGLVLCPTRELANQVSEQLRLLAKFHSNTKISTFVGGVAIGPQIASLVHTPSIVVGTPGRVMDLISKEALNISNVKCLVLDEADRMLDMGFADQMEWVLKQLPKQKQSLLFSATFEGKIEQLSRRYLKQAKVIEVDTNTQHSNISQIAYVIQNERRHYAAAAVLTHYQSPSCIIFCQTKQDTQSLADELYQMGFIAKAMHGDLTQQERQQVLTQFSLSTLNILVATDVAARGLDLEQVDLVINAYLADSADIHTHRIGRTGRSNQKGLAVTLIKESQEKLLKEIAASTHSSIQVKHSQSLRFHANRIIEPEHQCIMIDGGKKQKISKGDLIGALIKKGELPKDDIGKINVTHDKSYMAIKIRSVKRALAFLRENKVKGKQLRARRLK